MTGMGLCFSLVCIHVIYLNLLLPEKLFVELVRYIFSLPGVKEEKLSFLSGHINQDPLEKKIQLPKAVWRNK